MPNHTLPYLYVLGDFNADFAKHSSFDREFTNICGVNMLKISDRAHLPMDTFTFISKAHGSTSWLDHCVTSASGHDSTRQVQIYT